MKTLTKFKSMQEILLTYGGGFDRHGNLQVLGDSLAPSYFQWLGQLKEINANHNFPSWCIEKEYRDDAFSAHQALRFISSITTEEDNLVHELADAGLNNEEPHLVIKVMKKYTEKQLLKN